MYNVDLQAAFSLPSETMWIEGFLKLKQRFSSDWKKGALFVQRHSSSSSANLVWHLYVPEDYRLLGDLGEIQTLCVELLQMENTAVFAQSYPDLQTKPTTETETEKEKYKNYAWFPVFPSSFGHGLEKELEEKLFFTKAQIGPLYDANKPQTWKRNLRLGNSNLTCFLSPETCHTKDGKCEMVLTLSTQRQKEDQYCRIFRQMQTPQQLNSFQDFSLFIVNAITPQLNGNALQKFQLLYGDLTSLLHKPLFLFLKNAGFYRQLFNKQEKKKGKTKELEKEEEEEEPENFDSWLSSIAGRGQKLKQDVTAAYQSQEGKEETKYKKSENTASFEHWLSQLVEQKQRMKESVSRIEKFHSTSSLYSSSSSPGSSSASESELSRNELELNRKLQQLELERENLRRKNYVSGGGSKSKGVWIEDGDVQKQIQRLTKERDEAIERCRPTEIQQEQAMIIQELQEQIGKLKDEIKGCQEAQKKWMNEKLEEKRQKQLRELMGEEDGERDITEDKEYGYEKWLMENQDADQVFATWNSKTREEFLSGLSFPPLPFSSPNRKINLPPVV